MALEESSTPNDTVTEVDGIHFLIDKNKTPYFQNTKLDYINGVFGTGEYKLLHV